MEYLVMLVLILYMLAELKKADKKN